MTRTTAVEPISTQGPMEGLRLAEMAYLSEGQIPEEVGHGAVL